MNCFHKMVDVMHLSVIMLLYLMFRQINNVSKFDRVTNRITKGAKREREPSRVPVEYFLKVQKK